MGRLRPSGPMIGAALGVLIAALAGCPTPAADLCNADADCDDDLVCNLGACVPATEPPDDAGSDDAGTIDAGSDDAGTLDAGSDDAGTIDAGSDDAGTPDAGGCPTSEHDGGDGSCVALGTCASGFGLSYLDADGDGVGAGTLSADCAALPLAPGRSDVGSDCEPDDPDRFQLQVGFDDGDGDTYTAAAAQSCVGDVPAPGIVDQRRGPPHLARGATASSSGAANPWNSPTSAPGCCGGTSSADLDPAAATATLIVSDYTCFGAPTRIDLVRVRLRVRLPAAAGQPQALSAEATLLEGGNGGVTRSATTNWIAGTFSLVSIEGTAADWGLPTSDPTALCAGGLVAHVVIAPNGSYGGNVEIDYVVVELLGDDDCDPASAGFYAPLSLYGDGDGDTYVGGSPIANCVGDAALEEWDVLDPIDCDDTDNDARPDQTSYFTSQRNGGGWDYNCNGSDDKRSVNDATGCVEDTAAPGTCVETGSTSRSGSCGAQVDADYCEASLPCNLIQSTDPIACR